MDPKYYPDKVKSIESTYRKIEWYEKEEPILMHSLSRIGLVEKTATLDDVLNLEIENLLARRLQTILYNSFSTHHNVYNRIGLTKT